MHMGRPMLTTVHVGIPTTIVVVSDSGWTMGAFWFSRAPNHTTGGAVDGQAQIRTNFPFRLEVCGLVFIHGIVINFDNLFYYLKATPGYYIINIFYLSVCVHLRDTTSYRKDKCTLQLCQVQ